MSNYMTQTISLNEQESRNKWEPLIFFNAGDTNATVTVRRKNTRPGKLHWQYIPNFDKTKTYTLADLSGEDNYKALKYTNRGSFGSKRIAFNAGQAVAVYYVPDDKDNYGLAGNKSNERLVSTTSTNLECYGNIMAYIGVMGSKKPELSDTCFDSMFEGCVSLTKAPELPATELASFCYCGMFYGCKSLVNAPKLPATTLANNCYSGMFSNCVSLINTPKLPATKLVYGCYSSMFSKCVSLVNAPELPATTLANNCYLWMFYGCKSLIKSPELPATKLAYRCYYRMFYECSSLKSAKIMAVTSAESAFGFMLTGVNTTSGVLTVNKAKDYDISEISVPTGWTVKEVNK